MKCSMGPKGPDQLHSPAKSSSFFLADEGDSRALAQNYKAIWHSRKNPWALEPGISGLQY